MQPFGLFAVSLVMMNPPSALLVRRLAAGVAALGLAAATLLTSGCVAVVAAGAGAGAVAYLRGDLDATLGVGLDPAVRAANQAIERLRFAKVSESRDAMQAILVARNAADKRIEIKLERASDALTKIKIRVGVFGDEALSLAILEKVKANL